MMEMLNGRWGISNGSGVQPVVRGGTVDTLDSIWFGMKLGVAMIGMVMMRSLWREIWRAKRAGEQKNK